MHHLYPATKTGKDPLCPLGFHPQVRWPTRCKRCFRDYKEHGGNRKDESLRRDEAVTASTPSLPSSWTSQQAQRSSRESVSSSSGFGSDSSSVRSRTTSSSSSDLTRSDGSNDLSVKPSSTTGARPGRPTIWTSTPDLNSLDEETTCVTIRMPPRTRTRTTPTPAPVPTPTPPKEDTSKNTDSDYRSSQYAFRRRTTGDLPDKKPDAASAAAASAERARARKLPAAPVKEPEPKKRPPQPPSSTAKSTSTNPEVEFILRVKSSNAANSAAAKKAGSASGKNKKASSSSSSEEDEESDDSSSMAGTETTETTIVDQRNDEEVMELKRELDVMRARCEKLERDKSDILLRRLAGARETAPSSAEALKLQQRVHELQQASEDMRDEKHSLALRVKELEEQVDVSSSREPELRRTVEELRNKLSAAETLCEELMDENEEVKKEIRDLEEEIDEMQDNFREEQADEYTSLKKELEQTAKNCRILQFKLRKSERKAETMELAKQDAERHLGEKGANVASTEKMRALEKEVKLQSEVSERLQKEVEDLKSQLAKEKAAVAAAKAKSHSVTDKLEVPTSKKKPPMLGKSASGEPVTRASLTRGGSQDDPVQLLRDLQDSMEREADLREQLRFAEEEGQNFRKKCSRLEDDNDSLAMQLKKMATKARSRRHSPSPARLTPEPTHEKDEGISDDEDPAELRLQLELNEQESVVLRRKVEDLEKAGETARKQVKDLQDKLASKLSTAPLSPRTVRSDLRPASSSAAVLEKKITVLEEEASELRKKLIEKEREYERLQAELTIAQKRSKSSMSRSRSLDGSEQALDLKRQLQVIEQEAVVLRTRTQELEAENDKLGAENKKLSLRAASRSKTPAKEDSSEAAELKDKVATLEKQLTEANNKVSEIKAKKPLPPGGAAAEVEKLKTQMTKLEKENNLLKEGGSRLRTRTPKKPTDLTTKLQMKKMVEDLEAEVAELLVGLSKASPDAKTDTSTAKASDPAIAKELEEIRKERDKLKKDIEKDKGAFEKEKTKSESELKRLTTEKTKAQENLSKLESENKALKADIDKLKSSKDLAKTAQEEISKLKSELEEAHAVASALRREQEEKAGEESKKSEAEKMKLQKEVADKTKKLTDAEKKAKDTEDKLKKTERILSGKKEKLTKAEKDLEAEREKLRQSEVTQKEVSVGWLRERDELKASVTELTRKADQLQEQLSGRVREVEALEGSLTSERARVAELKSSSESSLAATSAAVEKQLDAAREELATAKSRATDLAAQLEKAEKAKKSADDKARKEITDLQSKLSDIESGRTADIKKLELQVKEKEQEVRSLNNQLKTAQQDTGSSSKRIAELQDDFNKKAEKLEQELSAERHEYEELTARYELLEEEHVVTKAQLTMDRDKAESAVEMSQQELATLEGELQTLRETYNSKQDAWIKEKLDMQEQVRELEEKLARGGGDTWNVEKSRLKDLLDEKSSELDQTKHEVDVLNDQNTYLRKDSDDLRRKLEDYEKVAKIQRTMSADTSALDKEIKELKSKLLQEEKSHKAEVAQLKMRYDSRVALISEELQSLQNQVAKFKRERDSTRHMLEAAQKTIGELRNATGGKNTPTHANISPEDESEETRTKLASLEQQLGCMEDELSDARLEASKLKTELVSERSAWEVKLSEMQSRLNELEEDRLMSSGRMKIPGMRTRMELAWQKERDEQHRLLQETSTLARDLRQTLFEVERERDKERLDGKRKLDQLKKNMEEEMEENRKKITEMQYDLLELRDAHAKLRTTNEKLRRERDRWEKDRDEQRQQAASRKRQELDEERKINSLLEQVEELMKLAPELFPQRKGPKSRESSPGVERRDYSREPSMGVDDRKQHLHSTLSRLTEATNELRKYQRMGEEEKDRERARRTLGFRRAASTEAEPQPEGQSKLRNTKANGSSSKKGGLFRKSLSLEQTSGGINQDQNIWTGDDGGSMNSLQSLEAGAEAMDSRFLSMQRRDPSVDRLSTDSTQSETTEKKKKKGLLGKLTKKLTKSRSIEETNTGDYVLTAGMQAAGSIGGSGSDISVDVSTAGTGKKDIKDRIAGMFKKTSSRSSSVERSSVDREAAPPPVSDRSESLQRPLKGANNAAILRPSPARSDISQTSSASRPLAPTVVPKPATPAASSTARSRFFR